MQAADRLIQEIVSSSRIPSAWRRSDILRELRAHLEDCVLAARCSGHSEEEAERLVFAHFGDPREIARQFGWVYRKERAALRFSVFLLSTAAVAVSIAAIVMTLQAGLAIGFGVPLARQFSARHTLIEAADILSTAAAYLGLISLENLFGSRRFPKAAAALAAIFGLAIAAFRIAGAPWPFLAFGLVVALLLRTVRLLLKNSIARTAAVLVCFTLFGLISSGPAGVASWLIAGAGYLLMSHLAVRIDGALAGRTGLAA